MNINIDINIDIYVDIDLDIYEINIVNIIDNYTNIKINLDITILLLQY